MSLYKSAMSNRFEIWFLGLALVFEGEETMIAALAENPSSFKVES